MRHTLISLVSVGLLSASCGRIADHDDRQHASEMSSVVGNSQGITSGGNTPEGQANPMSLLKQEFGSNATRLSDVPEYFCPSGFYYSMNDKLCVTELEAFGPFTREMIALCKKFGGGESACESQRWSRSFAARLRQAKECPRGSQFDPQKRVCRDGSEAYGPFKTQDVENCRAKGGGKVCETMRWHVSFVADKADLQSTRQRLFDFYSKRENYNQVFSDVLKFYPTGRSNGCVAFMSSALRRVGVNIPLGVYIGGESVSLVTKPFSRYLTETLGWIRIDDVNSLQPGDVVLTEDDRRYPGYPAHTYMFHSWSDRAAGIGWVIDNQDFIHERNVFGYGSYNFTPFAYALRSLE